MAKRGKTSSDSPKTPRKGKSSAPVLSEHPASDDDSALDEAPGKGTGRHLVIVESPTKAKTINKYLGKGYQVLASVGHVRRSRPLGRPRV
ncbi:MAG: hypothetical protein HC898_04985 [Phycisphaerales bacterium]|nr:hypothetical protein [Phycisphaerales bacterium]